MTDVYVLDSRAHSEYGEPMTMVDRVPITVRVPPGAVTYMTEQAGVHNIGRSDVIRVMLAVASEHPEEIKAKIAQMKESLT